MLEGAINVAPFYLKNENRSERRQYMLARSSGCMLLHVTVMPVPLVETETLTIDAINPEKPSLSD